jgi:hypothetical protein
VAGRRERVRDVGQANFERVDERVVAGLDLCRRVVSVDLVQFVPERCRAPAARRDVGVRARVLTTVGGDACLRWAGGKSE